MQYLNCACATSFLTHFLWHPELYEITDLQALRGPGE